MSPLHGGVQGLKARLQFFLGGHRHLKKNAVRGKAYCRVVESVIEKSSIDAILNCVCPHSQPKLDSVFVVGRYWLPG